MLQLNNKLTGEIIIPISSNETGTAYDYKKNGMAYPERITIPDVIDSEFAPDIPLNLNDLKEYLILHLLSEKNPNFEPSDDLQNWCISKGSAGNDTTVRILIPTSLIGEHAKTGDDLDLFLEAFSYFEPFSIRTNSSVITYLEEILPADYDFIKSFAGVIVDYKTGCEPLQAIINPVAQ